MRLRIFGAVLLLAVSGLGGFVNAQPVAPSLAAITAMIDGEEFAAAARELDRFIQRESGNAAAYTQRARVKFFQKYMPEAKADAEKALSMNGKDATALNVCGLVEHHFKDYAAATRTFTAALAADPAFIKAIRNRAMARAANKEPLDAVLKDYDNYLAASPKDVITLRSAGDHCLSSSGESSRCAAYFTKLKALKPDNYLGYLGFAMSYGNVFRRVTDKSIFKGEVAENFKKAIELDPKNANAHLQYGRMLMNLEDHEPCVASLTKAIELDSKNAWALSMRGDCYRMAGKYLLAIDDYTASLKLKPGNALVERFMGDAYKGSKNWDMMLQSYQYAAEHSDQDRDAFERLSQAYYMNTAWIPRGKSFYESLIAKEPANVCALEALGRLSGDRQKELLDRAIAAYDGKKGRLCAANAAFWLGRVHADGLSSKWGTAMDYYEKAISIDLTLLDVRAWMAKIYRPGATTQRGGIPAADKAKLSRQAYVDRTYLDASNEIKRMSDKFNAYNAESQNTLDTTLDRQAQLKRLKISEMTAIVALAKRTLADIGSEISQGGRDYLNRMITTGTQRLESLQR